MKTRYPLLHLTKKGYNNITTSLGSAGVKKYQHNGKLKRSGNPATAKESYKRTTGLCFMTRIWGGGENIKVGEKIIQEEQFLFTTHHPSGDSVLPFGTDGDSMLLVPFQKLKGHVVQR